MFLNVNLKCLGPSLFNLLMLIIYSCHFLSRFSSQLESSLLDTMLLYQYSYFDVIVHVQIQRLKRIAIEMECFELHPTYYE